MRPYHPDLFRRLARIRFDRDAIERDPGRFMEFQGRCIVLRAEMLWHSNQVEYVICAEGLPVVGRAQTLPDYDVKFLPEGNGFEFVPLSPDQPNKGNVDA